MNSDVPLLPVRRLHDDLYCPRFRLIIKHDVDQIMFVSLGPEDSKQVFRISTLGEPYIGRSRTQQKTIDAYESRGPAPAVPVI